MALTRVGSRELKTRLGTYLRRVRAGETLLVTDRGEVTAELRPPSPPRESGDERLSRLEAAGRVTLPVRRLGTFPPIPARKSLSGAIDEDRGDRI